MTAPGRDYLFAASADSGYSVRPRLKGRTMRVRTHRVDPSGQSRDSGCLPQARRLH